MSESFQDFSEKPKTEVSEKATRRTFDAAYKLRILEEVDRCADARQVGELLRREGLYASHLTQWRKARETGALQALGPKKRGRKPKTRDVRDSENERLRRANQRLEQRLKQAELIIEVQKKVAQMLASDPETPSRESR